MQKQQILYLVVPCYNEEEVINETTKRLSAKLNELILKKVISTKSKVLYVNDGSNDSTWEKIKVINKDNNMFTGISLSRNRGHQNALLAGLMTAKTYADVIISMDADLQDDINAIDEMLDKYYAGNDVVYGVRKSREKDTFFKRTTAQGFYKFLNFLGVDIVYNHADYRLMSKRALNELANFKEVNLFLRGIIPFIGFKSDIVYYQRNERFAGKSKYPLNKMISLACDGITSFSIKPIRFIIDAGLLIFTISIIVLLYFLIIFLLGKSISNTSIVVDSIWLATSIQLISIGIIGEYIGKIYGETKQRPRYIISEDLTIKKEKNS